MADNIAVTAGTGTTVGTDQVGTVHYQKIKLLDATAESETGVYVDIGGKANALRVAPANDITDATYIGDIKFGEGLQAGVAQIGSVTVANPVTFGSNVSLNASSAWIGLVTVYHGGGNVSLNASNAWIGLATVQGPVKNAGTTKTIVTMPFGISASGAATVFVPTLTFNATHLLLSSNATVTVNIMSGPTYLAGNASIGISLVPGGGWIENGSVDSPIYNGMANGGAFVVKSSATVNIGGKVTYYEE